MALAFIDDSGSGGDSPYYVLGGYVAQAPVWDSFSPAWQTVLDLPRPLAYFKMSEAESLKGQFLGFTAIERNERLAKFIDVILQHDLFEWSVAVPAADYRAVLLPSLLPAYRSPYYFAFIGMITALSGRYRWAGSNETVDFIFDQQDGLDRKSIRVYHSFKKWFPQWRLGRVGHGNDKHLLPLQAADLISWQIRRFMCATEGTRDELKLLHSKYSQPQRSRLTRSDLEELAQTFEKNIPSLIEEFGEERVQLELGRIQRKNQQQGLPSPRFLSDSLK